MSNFTDALKLLLVILKTALAQLDLVSQTLFAVVTVTSQSLKTPFTGTSPSNLQPGRDQGETAGEHTSAHWNCRSSAYLIS